MNRAQRRQSIKLRSRYVQKRNRIIKPWLHEIHLVFAPIDAVFDQLKSGEILCDDKGVPIFKDFEGQLYELCPAIEGWIETWEALSRNFRFHLDLEPLKKLNKKLEYGVILNEKDVEDGYSVINRCRELFRNMDVHAVKSVVRTQEIKIEMGL